MAHKNLVMNKLKDWAKRMSLVSFADAPAKPADLVAFEKGLVVTPAKPASPATTSPVAVPAQAKAPAPPMVITPTRTAAPSPLALLTGGSTSAPSATPTAKAAAKASSDTLAAFGPALL